MPFSNSETPVSDLHSREIFSSPQAAEFMDCTPQTLRAMVTRGELKAYTFGRHFRFKRADLMRAMKPVKVYTGSKAGDDLEA